MAAAFQCDCCGKFFIHGKRNYLVSFTEQSRLTGVETESTFDLCENCYHTMGKMLKKEENEQ